MAEFDKSKVYTALNADEVEVGSVGYFADNMEDLKECVANEDALYEVKEIKVEYYEHRFFNDNDIYNLFYLVKEPKAINYRPYESIYELLDQFDRNIDSVPNWVVSNDSNAIVRFNGLYPLADEDREDEINIGGNWYTMTEFYEKFHWKDGTKCGVKEE